MYKHGKGWTTFYKSIYKMGLLQKIEVRLNVIDRNLFVLGEQVESLKLFHWHMKT